jgi:hypothetical protein
MIWSHEHGDGKVPSGFNIDIRADAQINCRYGRECFVQVPIAILRPERTCALVSLRGLTSWRGRLWVCECQVRSCSCGWRYSVRSGFQGKPRTLTGQRSQSALGGLSVGMGSAPYHCNFGVERVVAGQSRGWSRLIQSSKMGPTSSTASLRQTL